MSLLLLLTSNKCFLAYIPLLREKKNQPGEQRERETQRDRERERESVTERERERERDRERKRLCMFYITVDRG